MLVYQGREWMKTLDQIVDRVEAEFAARIQELNNGEVEYVVEQLLSRFENHLNRVQAGSRDGAG